MLRVCEQTHLHLKKSDSKEGKHMLIMPGERLCAQCLPVESTFNLFCQLFYSAFIVALTLR